MPRKTQSSSLEAITLLSLINRAKPEVQREIQHALNENLYVFEIQNRSDWMYCTVVRAAHHDLVLEQVLCRDGIAIYSIFEDFPAHTIEEDAVLTGMLERYKEMEYDLWKSSDTFADTSEYGLQFLEDCKKTMSKSDYLARMRKLMHINITHWDWRQVNFHLDVFDAVSDWQE